MASVTYNILNIETVNGRIDIVLTKDGVSSLYDILGKIVVGLNEKKPVHNPECPFAGITEGTIFENKPYNTDEEFIKKMSEESESRIVTGGL